MSKNVNEQQIHWVSWTFSITIDELGEKDLFENKKLNGNQRKVSEDICHNGIMTFCYLAFDYS